MSATVASQKVFGTVRGAADYLLAHACALQFRKLGYEAVDMICEYMKTVPEARVVPDVQVSK